MPPKKAAAPKKTKKTEVSDNVVILQTSVGEDLVLRSGPSDEDVRNYVQEHTKRYIAGQPGGPSGIPAFRIFTAKRHSNEFEYLAGVSEGVEIDISDLLP